MDRRKQTKASANSRVYNCIKMLKVLYTKDVITIGELAKELDTNPRNIPEYRNELVIAGYHIETVPGRNGGYRMKKTDFFPTVRLTEAEKKALVASFEYVTKTQTFPSTPAYKTAMEKMMAANMCRVADKEDLLVISQRPFSMSEEEIQARYAVLSECVEKRLKLKMAFRSNDNVVRERVLHPYFLYIYNGAWFVLGYCESQKMVLPFKFNRIITFEQLNQTFVPVYEYREGSEWHEHLNRHGMKKVPDWRADLGGENASKRIKLRLTGKPAMYVKEYLYGADQTVTEVDKDTTILEFTTQFKYNTVQLVLGFGTDCRVLEPQWLIDEIVAQVEKIKDSYSTKGNKT